MFAGEVDLNSWYKPKIDKKVLKDLSKRSDVKGIIDISIFGIALKASTSIEFGTACNPDLASDGTNKLKVDDTDDLCTPNENIFVLFLFAK